MRAVVTVVGKDKTGIISKVMIMLVDLSAATEKLADLAEECREMGEKIGMSVHVQHEDIFNAMHKV